MKKLILLLILLVPFTLVNAANFPEKQVAYICTTAGYYIATKHKDCMIQQYDWYQKILTMGLANHHYKNALWYGQKYNYKGDVVGVDFKYVIDRAKYLAGIN